MDSPISVAVGELTVQESEKLQYLLGELVIRLVMTPERGRGGRVRSRRPPHPEVDPVRGESVEHAELLGDHQRCVVGQHDTARPEPNPLGLSDEPRHHQLRRGCGGTGHRVVLGHPEPSQATPIGQARQLDHRPERLADRLPYAGVGVVEDGQCEGGVPGCRSYVRGRSGGGGQLLSSGLLRCWFSGPRGPGVRSGRGCCPPVRHRFPRPRPTRRSSRPGRGWS